MKKTYQIIGRSGGNFEAGHRVMDHAWKCRNMHGHSYLYDLQFSFSQDGKKGIGYAIDFAEIKRVGIEFIERYLDHAQILNPKDQLLFETVQELDSKFWSMSINGPGEYCNPTVENIGIELFLALEFLFADRDGLLVHSVKLNETPKCYTIVTSDAIAPEWRENFLLENSDRLKRFRDVIGVKTYGCS